MPISPDTLEQNFNKLGSPYPGRGIIVGLSEPQSSTYTHPHAFLIEFTGGRSEGSLNRVLERRGNEIWTEVYDPRKQVGDAASTLYPAHSNRGDIHVVSNGRQTSTILNALSDSDTTFPEAQSTLDNEGPAGSYTSRIQGVVMAGIWDFWMGKVRKDPIDERDSLRMSYQLTLRPGLGYYLVTYDGKGGTDPSDRDPVPIAMPGTLNENIRRIWDILNEKTRGSIAGKMVNMETGEFRYGRIINRNNKKLDIDPQDPAPSTTSEITTTTS